MGILPDIVPAVFLFQFIQKMEHDIFQLLLCSRLCDSDEGILLEQFRDIRGQSGPGGGFGAFCHMGGQIELEDFEIRGNVGHDCIEISVLCKFLVGVKIADGRDLIDKQKLILHLFPEILFLFGFQ